MVYRFDFKCTRGWGEKIHFDAPSFHFCKTLFFNKIVWIFALLWYRLKGGIGVDRAHFWKYRKCIAMFSVQEGLMKCQILCFLIYLYSCINIFDLIQWWGCSQCANPFWNICDFQRKLDKVNCANRHYTGGVGDTAPPPCLWEQNIVYFAF